MTQQPSLSLALGEDERRRETPVKFPPPPGRVPGVGRARRPPFLSEPVMQAGFTAAASAKRPSGRALAFGRSCQQGAGALGEGGCLRGCRRAPRSLCCFGSRGFGSPACSFQPLLSRRGFQWSSLWKFSVLIVSWKRMQLIPLAALASCL